MPVIPLAARLALPLAAVAYGFATVHAVGPTSIHAGIPGAVLTLVTAGCLFAGGAVSRRASAAYAAGLCWLAPVWVAGEAAPSWVRSAAMVAIPFLLPALAHLMLRRPPIIAYVIMALLTVSHALVYDPFYDPACWRICGSDNLFLAFPAPAAAWWLTTCLAAFTVVFGVIVTTRALDTLRRMTPVARGVSGLVLLPGAVATGISALYGTALLFGPAERPGHPLYLAIFLAQAAALTCLAAADAWTTVAGWLRRSAVGRLADDLGSVSLQTALARVTGDPSLTVAYWLPRYDRYVDARGVEVPTTPKPGQTATSIVRDGQPVVVVAHDPGGRELTERIGPAARLAIDNERLRAEVLAQIADLRASRARVVAAGDDARRRLERDLHDGAQQRLLAVAFELRMAEDAAVDVVLQALEELRELAHGIFPVILEETGIEGALWSLAVRAPVAVELSDLPEARFPPPVERAVYLVTDSAIKAATGPLAVSVETPADLLVLRVTGAVPGLPGHLGDRVGALGGRLTATGGHIRVEIPIDGTRLGRGDE
ncbi:hypothetical protein Acor_14600 [Acrocarpospora corrugata]|uniref:Signal transduction histidine kinase subgroup 3 dimerisation and phosphoacceptor domain-containing protein n=1 Tax=Acrocarpospora corrugata TaxID=35763 RepID=A0A5M3VRG9_9ACTN|nr:histidine kinase [Acrocarpospora corrugata]GER99396.1 hypothetical protein Acor_14600 [Acrocarpospora corrugata]